MRNAWHFHYALGFVFKVHGLGKVAALLTP
ncbi:DUF3265 domain-containing protein [Vibrio parahaemolyticus]|nr:DUF3265 domain-containing protein [Vibrio parahaemolyticus]ELB2163990.1 DUF3265 domain-containing protein [Vibrio parahaemolyticus]ELB2187440.1 DUF3265 domain-containing protein [Vibrio parahaemolyticus]ELB2192411.1 DUF3265 domain-containing protein [Vibrio parahaemolyticus]ELB2212572.1 DUF3265 domain-containing protein [Vibrio parahaemolyticus]